MKIWNYLQTKLSSVRDTSLEQFGIRSREFVAEKLYLDIVTKKMLNQLDHRSND